MPFPPIWDLPFGAGGAGAGAGAAGGAGLLGGGIPWTILVPVVVSLLGDLFGKEEDPMDEALDLQRQMRMLGFKPPYQSPYLPKIDEATYRAILNQLRRTSNWGWPEGQQMDLSWLESMIANVPSPGPTGLPTRVRRIS